jgi:hypothetical protein
MEGYLHRLGNAWLLLAAAGLLARTLYLCAARSLQTGLAWLTKILTDPFNDIKTYWKAPYFLMKGQWLDPMEDVIAELRSGSAEVSDAAQSN